MLDIDLSNAFDLILFIYSNNFNIKFTDRWKSVIWLSTFSSFTWSIFQTHSGANWLQSSWVKLHLQLHAYSRYCAMCCWIAMRMHANQMLANNCNNTQPKCNAKLYNMIIFPKYCKMHSTLTTSQRRWWKPGSDCLRVASIWSTFPGTGTEWGGRTCICECCW